MAIRSNHYEAAFEAYIRSLRVPCVAVDEAKRAIFGDDGVKNPDFLLYPRFARQPGGRGEGQAGQERPGPARLGELGDDRRPRRPGALAGDVRARVPGDPGVRLCRAAPGLSRCPRENGAFEFRGLEYRFWAVGLDDYVAHLRSRGPGLEGGRRWPARRFAAGSARSANGCR